MVQDPETAGCHDVLEAPSANVYDFYLNLLSCLYVFTMDTVHRYVLFVSKSVHKSAHT